jgi:hypothetical protein
MPDIIIPSHFRTRGDHPFREFLESRDGRKFAIQVEMAAAMIGAVNTVSKRRRLKVPDVLDSVLAALVSIVQGAVPPEEWAEVSGILADTLRGRLMITGVNEHGE